NRTTRAGAHTPLWDGARVIDSQERSNYPLLLNLNDDGEGFSLGVQCCEPMDPQRIGANMRMAVAGLVEALAQEPQRALARIEVLPAEE
ncbi:non-ribosomal peptide synthetase, partial [Salinisphaera sp. USBA-960]|nr:non-ribosomal peptide synthetase [Salifodinibacter halophilus]